MAGMWVLAVIMLASGVTAVNIIDTEWKADYYAMRTARYNRNLQNPGSPCKPSPCGENTLCMVNGQGNPICHCIDGYIPYPSPIDGCCPPSQHPTSPVLISRQSDPCSPSPCGPGTTCTVESGNAICRCQPGFSPNPDTITGCKPECQTDQDCRMGFQCRSSRCVKKPNPCQPNPCGRGARCTVNGAGNALCECEPGLIPKPDTITGCGPECVADYECSRGLVCQSQRCVERPDPCSPSPCGPGARCMVTGSGNAICRCSPGLIPKPDTITGCGPECVRDTDCASGLVCRDQRCVERPDPCNPSPCGPGAECTVNTAGNAICRCSPGLIPNPDTITGCKPECIRDPDCQRGYICTNQKCVERPDPCNPSPCGPGASCTVNFNGNPICRCNPGLVPKPDTITGCGPECVRDPDCKTGYICQSQRCVERPDPCNPSPCGPNTYCTNTNGNPICKCQTGYIPQPDTITGCGRECQTDPDCRSGYVCRNYQCVEKPDPCNPSPCGPNTMCQPNRLGNPICRCLATYIPMPDTITGCSRECVRDPDCGSGYICQNYRCIEKPDPCSPSPCGPNTECSVTGSGNPICRCLPTYIPQPDTITGCARECETDPDCSSGHICSNYRCQPRPDPCDPSPCGPNTECNVNRQGNPVCTCVSGYSPQPDTITGCAKIEARTPPPDPCFPSPCGPNTRCEVNRQGNPVCKCLPGYSPMPDTISGCERIDPCKNNGPCGTNAECLVRSNTAECRCPPNYQGDPYVFCRKGECQYDNDCSVSLACINYKCRDPCPGSCGPGASCEVRAHRPVCSCPQGYKGDPRQGCEKNIVIGGRHAGPPNVEPSNTIVIGQTYREEQPQGRTQSGGGVVIGHEYKPQNEPAQTRHVVGSRYTGGTHTGGASLCGSCGGGGGGEVIQARTASRPSGGYVVVGSTRRKRNHQSFQNERSRFFRLVGRLEDKSATGL